MRVLASRKGYDPIGSCRRRVLGVPIRSVCGEHGFAFLEDGDGRTSGRICAETYGYECTSGLITIDLLRNPGLLLNWRPPAGPSCFFFEKVIIFYIYIRSIIYRVSYSAMNSM